MARDGQESKGFTIVELTLALAITFVLAAIAIPAWRGYHERARVKRSIAELSLLADRIGAFELENRVFPGSLTEIGASGLRDPWGGPYQYLRIAGPNPPNRGQLRKDKNLVPINTDFDLYSMGPDGDTKKPLTAKASRDDVIRANDGAFFGTAVDY